MKTPHFDEKQLAQDTAEYVKKNYVSSDAVKEKYPQWLFDYFYEPHIAYPEPPQNPWKYIWFATLLYFALYSLLVIVDKLS